MYEIKIGFYDDCASYESEKQFYNVDKNDVIDDILKIKHYSNKFNIKKRSSKGLIVYEIKSNDFEITATFPKKYEEENFDYIEFFESLIKQQKKRRITHINIALISSIAAIGTWELAKRDFNLDTLKKDFNLYRISKSEDYAISELERELEIHTCNAFTDEGIIYPEYDHHCMFEGGTKIPIDDRIENYCEKYLTNDEIFMDKVETKFKLLYDDNLDEADKIDLDEEYEKVKTKK